MTRTALAVMIAALAASSGCLNSLVDGACADGYAWRDGRCRLGGGDANPGGDAADADPDRPDADPDRPDADPNRPDALVCSPPETVCAGMCIDTTSNPNACGPLCLVCPTGICIASACVGGVIGRVVLIGHDYRQVNQSETRVLGNAMSLPVGSTVTVGVWRGTASDIHSTRVDQALIAAGQAVGLTWTRVDLPTLPTEPASQVVVIEPQDGTLAEATTAGTAWATAAQQFVLAGGVVIALGGVNTTAEAVLTAAGLLDAVSAGSSTGDNLTVSSPTDALAAGVLTPYHAEASTMSYTAGRGTVVVIDGSGDAVVIDAAGL